ncbi:hypothetical protein [Treponema sp. C6A8]|uniref:hypothetical protein n=1 Tax=Treponema sp. C6A8 TaxID=1410609 RepID=UPI0004885504|nr:hypothetical protein [Treponema sp. C6A8]
MNKLIRTEVLTVYISQFLLLLVISFCNSVPLWSNTVLITEAKYILICFVILTLVYFINIWFLCKKFRCYFARLPFKYMHASWPGVHYSLDVNCKKGKFTQKETEACKERLNDSMNWLDMYDKLSSPLIITDIICIFASITFILIKQFKEKCFYFSTYYGVAVFFVLIQISCLYISSRFLFYAVKSWVNKMQVQK